MSVYEFARANNQARKIIPSNRRSEFMIRLEDTLLQNGILLSGAYEKGSTHLPSEFTFFESRAQNKPIITISDDRLPNGNLTVVSNGRSIGLHGHIIDNDSLMITAILETDTYSVVEKYSLLYSAFPNKAHTYHNEELRTRAGEIEIYESYRSVLRLDNVSEENFAQELLDKLKTLQKAFQEIEAQLRGHFHTINLARVFKGALKDTGHASEDMDEYNTISQESRKEAIRKIKTNQDLRNAMRFIVDDEREYEEISIR